MFATVILIAKVVGTILVLMFLKTFFGIMVEVGKEREELIKITTEIVRKIGVSMLAKQPTEEDILRRCMSDGIVENMHKLLTFCKEKSISLGYACYTLRRVNTDDKIKFSTGEGIIQIDLPNGTVSFHLDKEPV